MRMNMATLKDINLYEVGNSIQMVGAVYANSERAYVTLFPEDHKAAALPLTFLEMGLDDWKVFLRQTDIVETEILTKSSNGELAKAIFRKSARNIDPTIQWNVFRRDGYACRYCGRNDVPLTVDHLVVHEDGGPNIEENLLSSCKKDNKVRSNLSYGEWLRHPHYLKVSQSLKPEVRAANEAVLATLDTIPRVRHVKSR
jgi:hypothetical protein